MSKMEYEREYSDNEVETLVETVWTVIIGMMSVDGLSNPIKFVREVGKLNPFFVSARTEYSETLLILKILDKLTAPREVGGEKVIGIPSIEQIGEQLAQADRLLQNHPVDAMAFRNFLYQLAMTVSNAAGIGLLGGGERISPRERDLLDMLKTKYKAD